MDKMNKARIAVTLDHPFFGSLALRMGLVADPDCQTAYTNGIVIAYNPDFVNSLSTDQIKGLFAHEVMHVALAHHLRRGAREFGKWNAACDYAINDILKESGFVLPAGVLGGMGTDQSAEAIYKRLPEVKVKSNGPDEFGEVRDYPGKDGKKATPAEMAQALQEVKVMVAQAYTQAKAMGNMPGGLERLVQTINRPRVDWREVLRRFMQQVTSNDYSWTPPNRRYVHLGLYLPALASMAIGEGVIAVDTSGSIGDRQVAQFASEITAIVEAVETTVNVVYCDTQVKRVETFCRHDMPIKIHPIGGGGTNFRPPFEWVDEKGLHPAYLVYLTDLEGTRFPDDPGYPVLWAKLGMGGTNPPFGECLTVAEC